MLDSLFDTEESGPSPPTKQRWSGTVTSTARPSTPPGYPRSATPPVGIYGRQSTGSRPGSPAPSTAVSNKPTDPALEAKRTKARKARLQRTKGEDYRFEDSVNLLHGLDDDALSVPSSRLLNSVATASIGVAAKSALSRGHHRNISGSSVHSRDTNQDAAPTLRRSFRRVIDINSAISVRMRTLDPAMSLEYIQALTNPSDSAGADEDSNDGLALSVEVENNKETGFGFELEDVLLEIGGSTAIRILKKPLLFAQSEAYWPLVMSRIAQENLLFYLTASDLLTGLSEARQETAAHTPISATFTHAQLLSRNYQQQQSLQSGTESLSDALASLTANEQASKPLSRIVSVLVKGKPVRLNVQRPGLTPSQSSLSLPSLQPAAGSSPLSRCPTNGFVSQWNCEVNLEKLILQNEERRLSTLSEDSIPLSKLDELRLPARTTAHATPFVGNRRYTASGLNAASKEALAKLTWNAQTLPPELQPLPRQHSLPSPSPSVPPKRDTLESIELNTPIRTPAFPPYQDPRPVAAVLSPISPTTAEHIVEKEIVGDGTTIHKPIPLPPSKAAQNLMGPTTGSGVLISVSCLPASARQSASASSDMQRNVSSISTSQPEASQRQPMHVQLFEQFQLELFVSNKSEEPRKVSIAIPTRKTRLPELARTNQLSNLSATDFHEEDSLAVGVVALDSEITVGPIASGASRAARMKFVAISTGVHFVQELAVTDWSTGSEARLRNVACVVVGQ